MEDLIEKQIEYDIDGSIHEHILTTNDEQAEKCMRPSNAKSVQILDAFLQKYAVNR